MTEFYDGADGHTYFKSETSSGVFDGLASADDIMRHPLLYTEYLERKARALVETVIDDVDAAFDPELPPMPEC